MALAIKQDIESFNDMAFDSAPVVIVGSGPVGVRTAQELLKINPDQVIVLYGAEPWEPYNRVRLTQMLAGHTTWADIFKSLNVPDVPNLIKRYNCPVIDVDVENKKIYDAQEQELTYSKLILATGSKPFIPSIEGVDLNGVYTFRNMSDVHQLMARRVRSRKTLVLGGGLLGIEAAKALQRSNTEVTILQHGSRLMGKQLDDASSKLVKDHIEALGINVILMDGVKKILGEETVSGVLLHSGKELDFDTVVLTTGIVPNVDLARRIGLQVGRGIRVDDNMQTSHSDIYAVGECVEHQGKVYGLVAPGLEQASVAAFTINEKKADYKGSIAAARLKVVGQPVMSVGEVIDEEISSSYQKLIYSDPEKNVYRKLVIHRGKLVGAIAMGEWQQLSRLQEVVTYRKRVWPWERLRFKRTGNLWSDEISEDVNQWPATATICNCTGVNKGTLCDAVTQGCRTVEQLSQCTGASSVCGTCRPKLVQLLGDASTEEETVEKKNHTSLIAMSVVALLFTLLTLGLAPIAYPDSVQTGWHISELWLDSFAKQVTGFTLLGLSVIALIVSLRKRIRKFSFGDYFYWRVFHAVLGAITLVVLLLHTGFSFGDQLNFALMLSFVGIALVGSALGLMTSYEAKKPSLTLERWKRYCTWGHIVFFWPLPALLGFHIVSSYYF